MSDFEFEARLERLFAQPPAVTDAGVFCRQVQARLDRDWTFRRALIGAAGVIGGLFAASQALGSRVWDRVSELQLPSAPSLKESALASGFAGEGLGGLVGSGEVVWMAAALLALAVAFSAAQLADRV